MIGSKWVAKEAREWSRYLPVEHRKDWLDRLTGNFLDSCISGDPTNYLSLVFTIWCLRLAWRKVSW